MEEISNDSPETNWTKSLENGAELYEILSTLSSRWSMSEVCKLYDFISVKLLNSAKKMHPLVGNMASIPYEHVGSVKKYGSVGKFMFAEPFDMELITQRTGIRTVDLIIRNTTPQMFRPAFALWIDQKDRKIILLLRGTKSIHDLVTDLIITPKEVEGGFVHGGVWTSSEWFDQKIKKIIKSKIEETGFDLILIGHSLGAAVCTVLATKWRSTFQTLHCYAIACPCVFSLGLAVNCSDYVTTFINGDDFGARLSGHSVDDLREQAVAHELSDQSWLGDSGPLSFIKSYFATEKKHTVHISHFYKDRLYPAGKIYFMRVLNNEIQFSLAKQQDFEILEISSNSIKDHRWASYEKALDLLLVSTNSYFV
jgi:hypothetical protein